MSENVTVDIEDSPTFRDIETFWRDAIERLSRGTVGYNGRPAAITESQICEIFDEAYYRYQTVGQIRQEIRESRTAKLLAIQERERGHTEKAMRFQAEALQARSEYQSHVEQMRHAYQELNNCAAPFQEDQIILEYKPRSLSFRRIDPAVDRRATTVDREADNE